GVGGGGGEVWCGLGVGGVEERLERYRIVGIPGHAAILRDEQVAAPVDVAGAVAHREDLQLRARSVRSEPLDLHRELAAVDRLRELISYVRVAVVEANASAGHERRRTDRCADGRSVDERIVELPGAVEAGDPRRV